LGSQIAHPQSSAWASGESNQDVEFLAGQFALALEQRGDRPVQARGCLEDEPNEGDPVAVALFS
jgi:hypothetical protein